MNREANNAMHTVSAITFSIESAITGAEPVMANRYVLRAFSRAKRNFLKLIGLCFLLCAASVGVAQQEAGSTEKVYRDYTEAYQKAAQSYEKAAKQSQNSSYTSWIFVAVCFVFLITFVAKVRRSQKAYMDRALELSLANQKVLEEIRDLLKSGRT